jgi:membrane protein YdbS with pleckstrin-like domain
MRSDAAATVTQRQFIGARTVASLALVEGRRILLHPVYLIIAGFLLLTAGVGSGEGGVWGREEFREALTSFGLLYYGLVTFFAANLVASSARRAEAESQLAPTPTDPRARTLATGLGVLLPAMLGVVWAVSLWSVEHLGNPAIDRVQSAAEVAVIPLCALGAGLLGVAVARWLPWPGAALVVVVALIAWVVVGNGHGAFGWTSPWSVSPNFQDESRLRAGSQAWHAVYLFFLCLLAGTAALLRHPPRSWQLLMAGAIFAIGAVVSGFAQLP